MGNVVNTTDAAEEIPKSKKDFRKKLLAEFDPKSEENKETVKDILDDLERVTGFKPAHVAKFLGRSAATIINWRDDNTYINNIRSAAKFIKAEWKFYNRNLFDF